MKAMLRASAAVLAGLLVLLILLIAVEFFSAVVHPLPADFGGTSEEMCQHVARYPHWVLAVVVPAWTGAALASVWTASASETSTAPRSSGCSYLPASCSTSQCCPIPRGSSFPACSPFQPPFSPPFASPRPVRPRTPQGIEAHGESR